MTIGPTTIDLEEWLHRLCAEDEQLTKELEEVRAQIAEIRLALGVHGKWREANPPEGEGIHDHIKPRDISRCRTQRDALEKIAMLSGGIANATEAAKIIVNTKLSKGKQTSVVSGVHGIMTNDESWEWVAPGTFRLRAYASQEQGGELTEVSPDEGDDKDRDNLSSNHALSLPSEPKGETVPMAPPGDEDDAGEDDFPSNGQTSPVEESSLPTKTNS